MRNSKLFLLLVLVAVFGLNLLLMGFCFWLVRQNRVTLPTLRSEIEGQLGVALTNIVDRIILDVGLRSSRDGFSSVSSSRSLDFVEAEIKTYEDMAFINGKVFRMGDFIAPYGMIMSIGKDCVALAMPNNEKSYLIAPPLPTLEVEEKETAESGGTNLSPSVGDSSGTASAVPASQPSKG